MLDYLNKLAIAQKALYREKPKAIAQSLEIETRQVSQFIRTKECDRLKLEIWEGLTETEKRKLNRLYAPQPKQEQLPL